MQHLRKLGAGWAKFFQPASSFSSTNGCWGEGRQVEAFVFIPYTGANIWRNSDPDTMAFGNELLMVLIVHCGW